MREQSPDPSLTRAEADRRRAILGLLADALAARGITSTLAGRRTLVLCSAGGRRDGYGPPARPADPQLYIFGAGNIDIVTTDGESYRFASGRTHPAADPSGAAQALVAMTGSL
jgi:hypothetical protein